MDKSIKCLTHILAVALVMSSVSAWAQNVSASEPTASPISASLEHNPQDPYDRYNRVMFRFNDKADQYILSPVARGYRKVTPQPVRTAVGNFFNNLRDVNSLGSNLLRGNIVRAGHDFMRVAVNSTFGLGGLINWADGLEMPNNKNTLGDTFASWGWENSHYFVLPLLGPSTVRDGAGSLIQSMYSPRRALIHDTSAYYALTATEAIDSRERLLDTTDTFNEMTLDKYTAMREAFMMWRNHQLGKTQLEDSDSTLVDPEADWQENSATSQPESTQE